ncbi:MAG TPA: branched-chain amino acid ABC transporter permease [Vineibacter sp.]|nr:branched-chain amino acid ABC transporter permease [Vineibacter sp.]
MTVQPLPPLQPAVGSTALSMRTKTIIGGGLIVALYLLPFVLGESYLFLSIDFLIMALFAVSYNLLLGQAGMLSFGHAAYYGLGAYTVAILFNKLAVPVYVGLLASPFIAGAIALAVGWFAVRVTGMYFAMLTLAFGQLLHTVVMGWYGFTGGDDGLPVMPPDWLLPARNYYLFVLTVTLVSLAALRLITLSAFGTALNAIRENRQRAIFVGLGVRNYELGAFVIAGAFAGIAGAMRAPLQQMAFPSLLHWSQSAEPVLMALAGGIHTFAGPIVGAAIFVFTNFVITTYSEYPLLVFGVIVLLVVLYLPGGVAGAIIAAWERLRRRAR